MKTVGYGVLALVAAVVFDTGFPSAPIGYGLGPHEVPIEIPWLMLLGLALMGVALYGPLSAAARRNHRAVAEIRRQGMRPR
jgi:hypothetical protein